MMVSRTVLLLLGSLFALAGLAQAPEQTVQSVLATLRSSTHLQEVDSSVEQVTDHEIGLGTLKKVRGAWGFKDSERLSGELARYTWQVIDGFSASEVLEDIERSLAEDDGLVLLFACDGRACGSSAQWANRVFGQRLLYGRVDLQQYRVYSLGQGSDERVLLYAASRSSERQYLHLDRLGAQAVKTDPEAP